MTSAAAAPKIRKARLIGHFPRIRTKDWALAGQDGGQSVRCGDATVFFFSDTLLVTSDSVRLRPQSEFAPVVPPNVQTMFLANCAAVTREISIEKALSSLTYFGDEDGFPREILPAGERERFRKLRFWPEHGVFLDGKSYFYYLGIQTTDPSTVWGFQVLGTGLARMDIATGLCSRLESRKSWMYWRNEAEDTHFGVQVLDWDGFVYVFGSHRANVQNRALLARVKPELIEDVSAYEYLSAERPRWSSSFSEAITLGPASSEYSVCWNPCLQKFAMFYLDSYQKQMMLRTADALWGPYSEPRRLFAVPCRSTSELAYLGFEHGSFQQDFGRTVFISYCEPHFSRASLVTVTFDLMDQVCHAG